MNGVLLTVSMIVLCACSRLSDKPSYSEADVRAFVQPGTSRDAIIRRFGEPVFEEKNPKSDSDHAGVDEIIYYSLPLRYYTAKRNGDLHIMGFQVRLREGKTVDWSFAQGR